MFPDHGDPEFAKKIATLAEFQVYAFPEAEKMESVDMFEEKVQEVCGGFEKAMYQHLVQNYLSRRSPYRGLLLFHGLGVGKTCSSITVAESYLVEHTGSDPRILIVCSPLLAKSYEEQIYNASYTMAQCTGETYPRLLHGEKDSEKYQRRIEQLIKTRYQFITYDGLVSYLEKNPKVTNKVIIVDEVHNLRQEEKDKRTATALETLIRNGNRNRLILLTATPMYNEPQELLWLFQLLLHNDHRTDIILPNDLFARNETTLSDENRTLLRQLASEYVSYIRGRNPYAFAATFSPVHSQLPVLKDAWAKDFDILTTRVGSGQYVEPVKSIEAASKLLSLLNITYPGNSTAKTGFQSMFRKTGTNLFPVRYISKHKDALMPVAGKLPLIAPKLQRIADFIRSSEGIVLVYSRYVWNGVVPLAVALEHMGFTRSGGPNILAAPTLVDNPVRYPGILSPKYAILSADTDVMIGTNRTTLIQDINKDSNLHGEEIKVVLITSVASEGITLKNVREVHILDPWYHKNLMEQVIGRAIRTCSHVKLPLEERNVTVYHHACVSSTIETADIHALKIAAYKWEQIKQVEYLLRDSAMDCSLLYHLNYHPKDQFAFRVVMKTSQGHLVDYEFGDEPDKKPACSPKLPKADSRSLRSEVYQPFFSTIEERLRKYITKRLTDQWYFERSELYNASRLKQTDIIDRVLEHLYWPAHFIPNYRMSPHRNGVVFIPITSTLVSKEIKIPAMKPVTAAVAGPSAPAGPAAVAAVAAEFSIEGLYESLPTSALESPALATYLLYDRIDSTTWPLIAQQIVKNVQWHHHPWTQILAKTGALIHRNELPHNLGNDFIYIGFVDIFNIQSLDLRIYQHNGQFRSAKEAEQKILESKRRFMDATTLYPNQLYGRLDPIRSRKDETAPSRFSLRLMIPGGANEAKKTGIQCTSLKLGDLRKYYQEITGKENTKDKIKELCVSFTVELLKKNRLLVYPLWKPT